jgi:Phosphotransferase enzyme family
MRQFRAAVESGRTDALHGLYAPNAILAGAVPGRTLSAATPEGIVAELSAWWSTPGRVDDWSAVIADGGIDLVVERVDAASGECRTRQSHWLRTDPDGRIRSHIVYSQRPQHDRAAPADQAPSFLRGATARMLLARDGESGARLERAILDGGDSVVVKYLSPSTDWIMRATNDTGREAELWLDGPLRDLPGGLQCPVVAAERHGDVWVIAQRDVSGWLLAADRRIHRDEARRVIAAADALHRLFDGRAPAGACTLADRAAMFSPRLAATEWDGIDLVPKLVGRGWELFATATAGVADDDVVRTVLALVEDPGPLVAALERDGTTLIHGDFKPANVGLTPSDVIAIDWGMACRAPAEVELAWYLECGAPWIDASWDDLVAHWQTLRGAAFDPLRWQLALLLEVVISGWSWALFSLESPFPVERSRCAAALAAWLERAREALDAWSP